MRMSLRMTFVLVLFLGLFLMTLRPVADPDFWWHLRTGQWIVENGRIPSVDPFSFTRAGATWTAHEWLSELLLYGLYTAGGTPLLVFVFSLVITGAFLLAYLSCSPEARPYLAGFSILLGAVASAPAWGVRPQMISLLGMGVFLFLLERYRRLGRLRSLVPLPFLTLLWVNLHAGFMLALAVTGLYAAGLALEGLLAIARKQNADFRPVLHLLAALGACTLASLANPNGIRILTYPFTTLTSPSMQQFIQEWFSPDFHQLIWQPLALLLLLLIGAGLIGGKPLPLTQVLVCLFFAYAALRSMRNVPLFVLAAGPVLADRLAGLLRLPAEPQAGRGVLARVLPVVILVVLSASCALRFVQVVDEQPQSESRSFPRAAVDWMAANRPPGELFNSYGWGGYLIWRLYPQYHVYVDGRADLYGDDFLYETISIYRAEPGWEDKLSQAGIRTVLIGTDEPLANSLLASPAWQVGYTDSLSTVFVQR